MATVAMKELMIHSASQHTSNDIKIVYFIDKQPIADSYFSSCSTPMLLHIKDPSHSAKSGGGRLQLNTHAPYVYGIA